MKALGRFWLRMAAIVAIGLACLVAAYRYRTSQRPGPVPRDVQREGLRLVERILRKVAATDFGRSRRGRLLAEKIGDFIRRDRLIFTPDISWQAGYRRESLGYEALYVKVLRIGGRLLHQEPEFIAEGIFHEAVHALRGRGGHSSIEEECDGFAAGLAAGAAVTGAKLPELLLIDGEPLARFVLRSYPNLPRNPDYRPVGQSRQWLLQRTGLR